MYLLPFLSPNMASRIVSWQYVLDIETMQFVTTWSFYN